MKHQKKWFGTLLRQRFFVMLLLLLQIALFCFLLLHRSRTTAWIRYSLLAVSFAVVLHVIAGRDKGAYKLTWVVILMTFPLIGGPLYLLFRHQTRSKRLHSRIMHITALSKGAEPLGTDLSSSFADRFPREMRQAEYLEKTGGFPVCQNTKTEFFSPAEMGYAAILSALEGAKKYIFLEFFIVEEGTMWSGIHDILKRKAAEGLDVRIIYDDIGCFLRLPHDYPRKLEAEGIKCRVFNPFRPYFTALQNSRDHRKIIAVDGKIAFTGGFNLADEYINVIHPFGHWKDAGIRLEGDGAWQMSRFFLQMWMLVTGKDEDVDKFLPCPIAVEGSSFVQPYADAPYDAENVSEHIYLQMIAGAERYLYINTPYLIVDDSMVSALCLAAKSGVDVRIVLPYHYDKAAVHFTTRSYYRELVRAGVRVYEYSDGFMHAKTFLSDGKNATVGTANLDFRSLYLQFECGVRLYGGETVTAMEKDFLDTLPRCREIAEKDCRGNALTRFLQEILRLFAPLM